MVDQQNPTSQFHSYQPPDATPHTEKDMGNWGVLRKIGLNDSQIETVRSGMNNVDLDGTWNRFREYARQNPGKVLGGMAALVIGTGLLMGSGRRHRKADKYDTSRQSLGK